MTVEGERQYGGNTGYVDAPSAVYRYDSNVANHRQVSEGDVVFLQTKTKILGMARIEKVLSEDGEKIRRSCPVCRTSNIKQRFKKQPRWKCKKHHLFDECVQEIISVKTFEAHYGGTYRPVPHALTKAHLENAVMRPSDQQSIKELDLAKIEPWLWEDAGCHQLVVCYADAIIPETSASLDTDAGVQRSIIDIRRRVLREVNLRRGQPQFRERLIRRYGKACQISRCAFPGLVEAAHITPYARTNENGAHNGLLLRSDLHTLFDLGLLAINPASLTVALHPALLEMGYGSFEGAPLFTNGSDGPDHAALTERWAFFCSRLADDEKGNSSKAP